MFNLNEATEALNGHPEFIVKKYNDLVIFDYNLIFPNSFEALEEEIRERAYFLWENAGGPCTDSDNFWLQAEIDCKKFAFIRRNFRGVTFSEKTGEIISLPLHKFFNVNQTAQTQFDLLKDYSATIYEKLDGSMIHFFIHHGDLVASTCASSTAGSEVEAPKTIRKSIQAKSALDFVENNPSIKKLIVETINNGLTPIFEYVARHNQIVIDYPKQRLVYLISRNRTTGEYQFESKFPDTAKSYEFKFSDVFNHLDKTNFEGYVCHLNLNDSLMLVKVKTPWYMERHRAVDALMRPKYKLFEIVFQGIMDDLIAIAADSYKPILTQIYFEGQEDLLREKIRIEAIFQTLSAKLAITDEPDESNKLKEFVDSTTKMSKTEAIIAVKKFTGLGISASKHFVETGEWPADFIHQKVPKNQKRKLFADLAKKECPDDFSLVMSLVNGSDPEEGIKARLMEKYRTLYPDKVYSDEEIEL